MPLDDLHHLPHHPDHLKSLAHDQVRLTVNDVECDGCCLILHETAAGSLFDLLQRISANRVLYRIEQPHFIRQYIIKFHPCPVSVDHETDMIRQRQINVLVQIDLQALPGVRDNVVGQSDVFQWQGCQ